MFNGNVVCVRCALIKGIRSSKAQIHTIRPGVPGDLQRSRPRDRYPSYPYDIIASPIVQHAVQGADVMPNAPAWCATSSPAPSGGCTMMSHLI
jgi:hypothetical protein